MFLIRRVRSRSSISFRWTWMEQGRPSAFSNWAAATSRPTCKNYFSSLGIKQPNVISVLVDKGKNKPTNANSADGEVLLDIEVVGAVAPGAKIVVYFAPNTTAGISGCAYHGDSRRHQQTVRHLDQLGRPGIHLDRPVHDWPSIRPPRTPPLWVSRSAPHPATTAPATE